MPQNWTILCLVHAEDPDTKDYANQFIEELCQTPSASHLRLFCLRNTYAFDNQLEMDANLFELVFDAQKEYRIQKLIKPFGKINLGDPTQLSKILDTVKNGLPENRFILLTWDHGYAFGVFDGNVGNFHNVRNVFDRNTNHRVTGNLLWKLKKVVASDDFDNNVHLLNRVETFRSERESQLKEMKADTLLTLSIQNETDMLLPEEIANAIKISFGNKKIDLLIMMNCWMQSVDTIYALRDAVQIIIAPQTTIDFIGYDYHTLVSEIVKTPNIPVSDLSFRVVAGTKAKYKRRNTPIAFNEVVISAIKIVPNEVIQLRSIIDDLSTALKTCITDAVQFDLVRVNRSKTYEFTRSYLNLQDPAIYYYYLVDLVNVTELFEKAGILNNFSNKVYKWFSDNVIKKEIGENFINSNGKETACAMTIYFPNNKEYVLKSNYYHILYKMPSNKPEKLKAFAKDSQWPAFIQPFNDKL